MIQKVKSTEKIMRMIETENVLLFETDRKFKKPEIRKEIEKLFNVKVENVNTHIRKNKKLIYVKLKSEFHAIDIATKLGLI
ncbi:MAG: 50S ribosomal protein L23 [Nanoarchaeota archaeon]